jgi:hypothetical protein
MIKGKDYQALYAVKALGNAANFMPPLLGDRL